MLFSPYILQLIDQWSQHTIRLPHLSYPLSINTHNSMSYWPWAIVTIKNYNNNNNNNNNNYVLLAMGHSDNKELQQGNSFFTAQLFLLMFQPPYSPI